MIDGRASALFNALIKAYRECDSINGPRLLEAVKAYTGAERVELICNKLILAYKDYEISYSIAK